MEKEKNKFQPSKINSLLALTSIIAVLISAFFIWQNNSLKKLLAIRSFEDCIKAQGSQIEAVEPPKCTTLDGREFFGQSQKEVWQKYEDEDLSFEYPAGIEVKKEETEKEITRKLTYTGPTQKENTELYDGYSFSITQTKDSKQSSQALAKKERQNSLEVCDDPKKVSEIEETEIAKIKAYKFESDCLGKMINIYLENSQKLYRISLIWSEDKKYQEILQRILSGLNFSK